MVEFNKTKGGDIEGQIKNNLAKPSNVLENTCLTVSTDKEILTLHYSRTLVLTDDCSACIDNVIELITKQRHFLQELEIHDDMQSICPVPLFNLALDKEGYEILAWSDEDNCVVKTPHKTGDA